MLISAMVGIDLRATLDMDATVRGFELNESNLFKILNEIIQVDVDDDVKIEIINIIGIREEDEYGGFRVTFKSYFDTISVMFKIDITTGDVIIPKEINYEFKPMFKDGIINVLAYNLETVMSEKYHSIITHGIKNTRARDFYDLYILNKFQRQNYDDKLLSQAINEKFISRNTKETLDNNKEILELIENSNELKNIWKAYTRDYVYAKDISYEDIMEVVKEISHL